MLGPGSEQSLVSATMWPLLSRDHHHHLWQDCCHQTTLITMIEASEWVLLVVETCPLQDMCHRQELFYRTQQLKGQWGMRDPMVWVWADLFLTDTSATSVSGWRLECLKLLDFAEAPVLSPIEWCLVTGHLHLGSECGEEQWPGAHCECDAVGSVPHSWHGSHSGDSELCYTGLLSQHQQWQGWVRCYWHQQWWSILLIQWQDLHELCQISDAGHWRLWW